MEMRPSYGVDQMTKSLQEAYDSYAYNRADILTLCRYAAGLESDLYKVLNISEESRSALKTVEGMRYLQKWAAVFHKAFELQSQFDSQYASGVSFNTADWRLMDNSSEKALSSLEAKLAKEVLPTLQLEP